MNVIYFIASMLFLNSGQAAPGFSSDPQKMVSCDGPHSPGAYSTDVYRSSPAEGALHAIAHLLQRDQTGRYVNIVNSFAVNVAAYYPNLYVDTGTNGHAYSLSVDGSVGTLSTYTVDGRAVRVAVTCGR